MKEALEPVPENLYEKLKSQLLSGNVPVQDFIKRLDALDQSTDDRRHALENLEILEDSEVKGFCIASAYVFL